MKPEGGISARNVLQKYEHCDWCAGIFWKNGQGCSSTSWGEFSAQRMDSFYDRDDLQIQWNSVITYPQGKWKKVRSNQSTFYPKRDFPHRQDRFHVFTRTICHGRCLSVLNVVHCSVFVRWNRLSGHRELENVPRNWNRNWKVGWHARDHKKQNQRKGKKVLLEGKLVRNIQCCATFCTSYTKKLAMSVIDGENVTTECTY